MLLLSLPDPVSLISPSPMNVLFSGSTFRVNKLRGRQVLGLVPVLPVVSWIILYNLLDQSNPAFSSISELIFFKVFIKIKEINENNFAGIMVQLEEWQTE